jgi:hypothetical protein
LDFNNSPNFQPWGYKSVARSLINENEKKRRLRFQDARTRSADISEQLRNEVLALDFFQLRGKQFDYWK